MKNTAIIVMAKIPIRGKVKTRLAADIGDYEALKVYKSLLFNVLTSLKSSSSDVYVYQSPYVQEFQDFPKYFYRKQSEGDLGDRMQDAAETLLEQYKKVIVMGADIPNIDLNIIEKGFKHLDICDFCIGPTEDGGYYMIGMKTKARYIFHEIEWSTPYVFGQTLDKIQSRQKSVSILARKYDVDTLPDMQRWKTDQGTKSPDFTA